MTFGGVQEWLRDASLGQIGCALKILSSSFGKEIDQCGACLYCCSIPTTKVQLGAARRIEQERREGQATDRVLRKLALVCLVCNRKTQCFNKTYLNNIACCECWVFKNVPGSKRHNAMDCEVKGRLRRLLSHHFLTFKVTRTFKEYIEGIYTSTETFCGFMATVESKYMVK